MVEKQPAKTTLLSNINSIKLVSFKRCHLLVQGFLDIGINSAGSPKPEHLIMVLPP